MGIVHGNVSYPGLLAPEALDFVCGGHEITPGTICVKMQPQPDAPARFGTMVITDEASGRIVLPNCRLVSIQADMDESGLVWLAYFEDRRWRWRYGMPVNLCVNQLSEGTGKLIPGMIMSPMEIACYLLTLMGETLPGLTVQVNTNGTVSLTTIPNFAAIDLPPGLDTSFRLNSVNFLASGQNYPTAPGLANPALDWRGRNAAECLAELAQIYGRRVVYVISTDSIMIARAGVGGPLPPGGAIAKESPSLKAIEACDSVMVQGKEIDFQVRLATREMALEFSGRYVPANEVSYAPRTGGQPQITTLEIRMPLTSGAGAVFHAFIGASGADPETAGANATNGGLMYSVAGSDETALTVASGLAVAINASTDPLVGDISVAVASIFTPAGQPTLATVTLTGNTDGLGFSVAVKVDGSVTPGVVIFESEPFQQAINPTEPWANSLPPNFPGIQATDRLTIDQARALAAESVFRCYQVTGLDVSSGVAIIGSFSTTQGSQTVRVLAGNNFGVAVGLGVSGIGIRTGTTVQAVNWPNVTLSKTAQMTQASTLLTFVAPTTGAYIPGYGRIVRRQQLVLLNHQVDQIVPTTAVPPGTLVGQLQITTVTVTMPDTGAQPGTLFSVSVNGQQQDYEAVEGASASDVARNLSDSINAAAPMNTLVVATFSAGSTSATLTLTSKSTDRSFNCFAAMAGPGTGGAAMDAVVTQPNIPVVQGFVRPAAQDEQYILDTYQGFSKSIPPRAYGAVATECISKNTGIRPQGYEDNTSPYDFVPVDFSIVDQADQVIQFASPVWLDNSPDGVVFPNLALQIAVNVRDPLTGQLVCFQSIVPVTDQVVQINSNGTASFGVIAGPMNFPKVEVHDDCQASVTSAYSQKGDLVPGTVNPMPPNTLKSWSLLEADPLLRAAYYIQGALLQLQVSAGETRTYLGLIPIDCSGSVQQVSYRVGPDGCDTTASLNTEHDHRTVPYPERRRAELLPALLEQAQRNRRINLLTEGQ